VIEALKGNKNSVGNTPWNKGTKGKVTPWNKGKTLPPEMCQRISEYNGMRKK
jgi:hypothetical protein